MSCNGTTCGLLTHSCLTVMGGNKRGHTVCVTFPQGGREKREERQLKRCFNFKEASQTEAYVQIISHHMLCWLKGSDGRIYIFSVRGARALNCDGDQLPESRAARSSLLNKSQYWYWA